jgi:hypothetical protein
MKTTQSASDAEGLRRVGAPRASLLAIATCLACLSGAAAPPAHGGASMTDRPHAPDRTDPPRARDGDTAIRQEFQAATTAAALRLFVERHPGHPLAAEARERLRALGER